MEEKRKEQRYEVQSGKVYTLTLEGNTKAIFAIEDVSLSGMRLRFMGNGDDCPFLDVGDKVAIAEVVQEGAPEHDTDVVIDSVPVDLSKVLADKTGTIIWKDGCMCGVELESPVSFYTDLIGSLLEEEGLLDLELDWNPDQAVFGPGGDTGDSES